MGFHGVIGAPPPRPQGEEPGGRPLDLASAPPQDKKLEGEKRGMSLGDYGEEMRKGGRGGPVFRSAGSKEAGPADPGPYYDKVTGAAPLPPPGRPT